MKKTIALFLTITILFTSIPMRTYAMPIAPVVYGTEELLTYLLYTLGISYTATEMSETDIYANLDAFKPGLGTAIREVINVGKLSAFSTLNVSRETFQDLKDWASATFASGATVEIPSASTPTMPESGVEWQTCYNSIKAVVGHDLNYSNTQSQILQSFNRGNLLYFETYYQNYWQQWLLMPNPPGTAPKNNLRFSFSGSTLNWTSSASSYLAVRVSTNAYLYESWTRTSSFAPCRNAQLVGLQGATLGLQILPNTRTDILDDTLTIATPYNPTADKDEPLVLPIPGSLLADIADIKNGILTIPEVLEKAKVFPLSDTDEVAKEEAQTAIGTSANYPKYQLPGITEIFPFCLPFDVYRICTAFVAEPEAPSFTIPIPTGIGNEGIIYTEFDVNLEMFDMCATVLRALELIGFVVLLATATRRIYLRG